MKHLQWLTEEQSYIKGPENLEEIKQEIIDKEELPWPFKLTSTATWARVSGFTPFEGGTLAMTAETVCVHSDTPGAPEILKAVRDALDRRHIAIAPPE